MNNNHEGKELYYKFEEELRQRQYISLLQNQAIILQVQRDWAMKRAKEGTFKVKSTWFSYGVLSAIVPWILTLLLL